jgi:hypothetical protein
MTAAAFPFVKVDIDTSGLQPTAERSPGVIAIVGKALPSANAGAADPNTPYVIATLDDAKALFAKVDGDGNLQTTTIYDSIELAFLQDPQPSKIYAVQVQGTNYAAALTALEARDDVTMVSLANEYDPGATGSPPTNLQALKAHVEDMSSQGKKRIGVAMIDPTRVRSATYATDAYNAVADLKSGDGRMVMMAARGSTQDVATAAMAAIAGYEPQVSMVLKPIRGITMPQTSQYGPGEITALTDDDNNINPVIDPDLIVGTNLYFAEDRTFTGDASRQYIDIVRVLDDIDFRLKAGLIGAIGDSRITLRGLTSVKLRTQGILEPLRENAVIDAYDISIPVLDILSVPDSARSPGDTNTVTTARADRAVDMYVSITYGPAVHYLHVTLKPSF